MPWLRRDNFDHRPGTEGQIALGRLRSQNTSDHQHPASCADMQSECGAGKSGEGDTHAGGDVPCVDGLDAANRAGRRQRRRRLPCLARRRRLDGLGLKRHTLPIPLHLHRTDRSRLRFISGLGFEQLVAMRARGWNRAVVAKGGRGPRVSFGAAHLLHGLRRHRRLHVHVRQRLLALLALLRQAKLLVLGQLGLGLLGLLGLGLLGLRLRLLAARARAAPATIPQTRSQSSLNPIPSSLRNRVSLTCRPWLLCARCARRQVPPIP